jgi:hypothetical protein
VLRTAALIGIVLLTAAGCGGGSGASGGKASHTVLQVSKAFSDAGIPFSSIVTSNPYVRGQQVYLPLSLNNSDASLNVLAQLSGSKTSTRNGWIAWVFDTDAHAQDALKQVPLDKWGQGEAKIERAAKGNVIVVGSGFTGAEKKPFDDALSSLG